MGTIEEGVVSTEPKKTEPRDVRMRKTPHEYRPDRRFPPDVACVECHRARTYFIHVPADDAVEAQCAACLGTGISTVRRNRAVSDALKARES